MPSNAITIERRIKRRFTAHGHAGMRNPSPTEKRVGQMPPRDRRRRRAPWSPTNPVPKMVKLTGSGITSDAVMVTDEVVPDEFTSSSVTGEEGTSEPNVNRSLLSPGPTSLARSPVRRPVGIVIAEPTVAGAIAGGCTAVAGGPMRLCRADRGSRRIHHIERINIPRVGAGVVDDVKGPETAGRDDAAFNRLIVRPVRQGDDRRCRPNHAAKANRRGAGQQQRAIKRSTRSTIPPDLKTCSIALSARPKSMATKTRR